ncbi:50S ribosomal protein L15 [Patescibacteria group bacterium]|nr:50S ribosomal protein L15 [Patescibacteria group bacterium]
MKYNELQIHKHKSAKRVGRGIAGGQGKTAGRGTKGQKARAGWSLRPGFAGGQNPLMQQLPKLPGFKSYRNKAVNVFTNQLQELKENTIDAEVLAKVGLVRNPYERVKLLNRGKLNRKIIVKLPAASAAAIATIETAGGTFEKVERIARPAKPKGESK